MFKYSKWWQVNFVKTNKITELLQNIYKQNLWKIWYNIAYTVVNVNVKKRKKSSVRESWQQITKEKLNKCICNLAIKSLYWYYILFTFNNRTSPLFTIYYQYSKVSWKTVLFADSVKRKFLYLCICSSSCVKKLAWQQEYYWPAESLYYRNNLLWKMFRKVVENP